VIGELLGDYRILARIGAGGFGVVYLAEDQRRYERVAVKVLGDRMDPGSGLKRFGRELEVLQRVVHPRIVAPLSPLSDDGERHYFAMELVRGRNLAEVLAELGCLEVPEALRIASDALDGLASAHEAGVLHRDFKSANLLLDAEGEVRVCDFGLARAVDQTRQTLSQTLLGTPAYLSPEQASGLDARVESDIYSVGVVLYESLTGTLPFRAETPVALLRLHLEATPDAPSRRRPGLPPELDALVLKALHKDPDQRFASADEMRAAIEELRASLGPTDPDGKLRRVIQLANRDLDRDVEQNRAQRSGGIAIWVGVGLLVAVFGFGLLRVAEPGGYRLPEGWDTAAIGSADHLAPLAEIRLSGGQAFIGHLTFLENERVRLVTKSGVALEAPRAELTRIRYLEDSSTAPVGS
jgi:serine/threonine protein kinase